MNQLIKVQFPSNLIASTCLHHHLHQVHPGKNSRCLVTCKLLPTMLPKGGSTPLEMWNCLIYLTPPLNEISPDESLSAKLRSSSNKSQGIKVNARTDIWNCFSRMNHVMKLMDIISEGY